MSFLTTGRRLTLITRTLVSVCGTETTVANVGAFAQPPTFFASAQRRGFAGVAGAWRASWNASCGNTKEWRRVGSLLETSKRKLASVNTQTRQYAFQGHPQIRNAEGQDMAQVRAGVRLRKALCAVLEHPSVSHRFENTGLTLLEVRMGKDFKKAHVRWTVADGGGDDESNANHGMDYTYKKKKAAQALKQNATTLRSMASKMLRSKHTPRLVFVDDDTKTTHEVLLDEALDRVADDDAAMVLHLCRVKKSEREYREGVKKGLLPRGKYDFGENDSDDKHDDSDRDTENTEEEDKPKGYAFETYDGSVPFVSDFVERDDLENDDYEEDLVHSEEDSEESAEESSADSSSDDAEHVLQWQTKVRSATAALREAEMDWLALSGGSADELHDDGFDSDFDAAVDELIEEISTSGDDESVDENVRAIRLAASRAKAEAEYDDDENDEGDDLSVPGDEFDDETEVEDFDFAKFDKATRGEASKK